MLGRAFQRHRWRLISVAAIAVVALFAVVAFAMATQWGTQRISAEKPPAKEPPPSLGIDLRGCPKAEPEKLPPDALADATKAALDQVPLVFGDDETTKGAYAVAAYLGKSELGRSNMIRRGLGCSQMLQDRSVVVDLIFPKLEPSASLSQHTVFVANFEGDYWVYGIGH